MKMTGSHFADTLLGGKKKDLIIGNNGNDLISAWEDIGDGAADEIRAGAGDDLIGGFSFNLDNVARSKSRGASVDGGTGYDSVIVDVSGNAKTTLLSRIHQVFDVKAEEIIYNFSSATIKQTITGTNANETIYIGENGSKASGGKGNDYLIGGQGEDVLIGGDGNDFLFAAGGRNELTGGKGADVFQFHLTEDYAYANVTDFQAGVDKIALVIDIGGEFYKDLFGDELRRTERTMDDMGYINYDDGRIIDRGLFDNSLVRFTDNMIYEQSTGSFLQRVYLDDGNGGTIEHKVLLAHVKGENNSGDNGPVLTEDDFIFYVL
jgi:hypothetical protein